MWQAWGEGRFYVGFWSEKMRDLREDQLADQDVDGIVLKSRYSGSTNGAVECIYLFQDREK